MTSQPIQHYHTDVVIIGFGAGADVVLLEKQPEATHYSNTRMSGGGFHQGSESLYFLQRSAAV